MTAHDTAIPARRRWRRAVAWVAVAAALGVVFLAYRSPHLVVDLANRLWACF
jgi:hypothetical protein